MLTWESRWHDQQVQQKLPAILSDVDDRTQPGFKKTPVTLREMEFQDSGYYSSLTLFDVTQAISLVPYKCLKSLSLAR